MQDALERQAASCRHLGSELYGSLLEGLAADHRRGGITCELLRGASTRPVHDALPLRLLGAVHRLALEGHAPEVARHYPSCDGDTRLGDPTGPVLAAMREHAPAIRAALATQVQTNEPARAVAIATGLSHVTRTTRLPLHTLEIGASAGLVSRWPHYRLDDGHSATGPPDADLRFGPEWFETSARLEPSITVLSRRASDVAPMQPENDEHATRLLSFLWPDQTDRIDRLRRALGIAAADPLDVEQADAGEWLGRLLAAPPVEASATVVFHSIVWQYLSEPTRHRIHTAFSTAARWATPERPVAWVRMEPATAEHADIRVTIWPTGEERVVAMVGYHGRGLRWTAPTSGGAGRQPS